MAAGTYTVDPQIEILLADPGASHAALTPDRVRVGVA
jgi:hypothetical protein